jgi:hypothetical protein
VSNLAGLLAAFSLPSTSLRKLATVKPSQFAAMRRCSTSPYVQYRSVSRLACRQTDRFLRKPDLQCTVTFRLLASIPVLRILRELTQRGTSPWERVRIFILASVIVGGGIAAATQCLVLRRNISWTRWWAVLVLTGWTVGSFLGVLIGNKQDVMYLGAVGGVLTSTVLAVRLYLLCLRNRGRQQP